MFVDKYTFQPSRKFIALFALTTIFGLQLLRNFFPFFTFLLKDRFGWSTLALGLLALLIFLTAFLADPLIRFFGGLPSLLIVVIGIGINRLAVQFWRFDPVGDFVLSTIGVISFLLFLPISLGISHRSGRSTSLNFAFGLLFGVTLDLLLNGAFISYDLSWQSGWLPTLTVAVLFAIQLFLISRILDSKLPEETADAVMSKAKFWLIIGPYLFLQLLFFSNIGWMTSNTSLSFPAAFTFLIFCHVAAFLTLFLPRNTRRLVFTISICSSLIFTIIALLTDTQPSWLILIFVFLSQTCLTGFTIMVVQEISEGRRLRGLGNFSIIHGISMILLLIFIFGYYAGYDLSLPFPNTIMPLIAFLIIFLTIWPFTVGERSREEIDFSNLRTILIFSGVLIIIPLFQWATWRELEPKSLDGEPIYVMTFNVHNGMDPLGHLGLEAIAQVIEREGADVVGLQEVSRGWIINGSVDMLSWLSQRLGMTALYGPTAGNQWGNAILTRLPVIQFENHPLPIDGLPLDRGYMFTELDRGNGQILYFINTHFHHPANGGDIRHQESIEILGEWNERPSTIIVGDLNAEPGQDEINIFTQAGFLDVLETAGIAPGFTFPATNPNRKIDYIWITPDLTSADSIVFPDQISDHLSVGTKID